MAFVACQLVPLDKKPDMRPILIGDVLRWIIARAILYVIHTDIQLAAGALQTCADHVAGVEGKRAILARGLSMLEEGYFCLRYH